MIFYDFHGYHTSHLGNFQFTTALTRPSIAPHFKNFLHDVKNRENWRKVHSSFQFRRRRCFVLVLVSMWKFRRMSLFYMLLQRWMNDSGWRRNIKEENSEYDSVKLNVSSSSVITTLSRLSDWLAGCSFKIIKSFMCNSSQIDWVNVCAYSLGPHYTCDFYINTNHQRWDETDGTRWHAEHNRK